MTPTAIPLAEWRKRGEELFGPDPRKWRFRCPRCGNIQSINSILEHNTGIELYELNGAIYTSCEGRTTEGHGCDWTLFGLLHIHTAEVVDPDGEIHAVFEFDVPADKAVPA